jgi:hypothetical protein
VRLRASVKTATVQVPALGLLFWRGRWTDSSQYCLHWFCSPQICRWLLPWTNVRS